MSRARTIAIMLVGSWILLAVTVSPSLAQASPPDVYQQYIEAYQRRDVAAIVALFAEDGVFVGGGGCRPTPCTGKVAIQRAYEIQLTGNYRLTVLERQANGDTISWRATLENDATRAAGVGRIVTTGTAEIRDGRIAALRGLPDPSDAETARFVAWQSAQPPATPAALPRAGDAMARNATLTWVLAAIGLAMVTIGVAGVKRRAS